MGLLLDSLRSVEFLSGASQDTVERFMVTGTSADFPKSHVFWRAGREPECLVIPVSGEAKSTTRSSEGREFIEALLGSGECIGLASALDGYAHPTDTEVVRAGEFFSIARPSFLEFLDRHPGMHVKALGMVAALYRRNLREREDVALRPVPERVARFLLRHTCVRQQGGARVLLHATQAEMAARLGTVREVVARVIGDLEERGIIARLGSTIFICDWDGLAAEAALDAAKGSGAQDGPGTSNVPAQRTERFFLPTVERMRRHEDADEVAKCRQYLTDLSICRQVRCPGALQSDAKRRPV